MKQKRSINVLAFQKAAVTELNHVNMTEIYGGTSVDNGIVDTCTITVKCQTKDW